MSDQLPIDALYNEFMSHLGRQPIVVSSPTGSGKSTRIPQWCLEKGRVLVVEPRRVACRALADRVSRLGGTRLGTDVGYRVRDDDKTSASTRVVFATPGIALKMCGRDPRLQEFHTIILDEFHERTVDVDLLLAVFTKRRRTSLVVMSATLAGDRLARHLEGVHLEGDGRLHPVDVIHRPGQQKGPDGREAVEGVNRVLTEAMGHPGHILIFMPGKAEIRSCSKALSDRTDTQGFDILELHGGLSLEKQQAAFADRGMRKIIVATNVAETSVTVPGVGVVIDSGLVRRTRYYGGRGFLTLMPIAQDSAEQRRGRAGRTGPGVCFRLWPKQYVLETETPPEVFRESLVELVFHSLALGVTLAKLPFLDPPTEDAVEAATGELAALGAIGPNNTLSEIGRALFGLPLDVQLGRMLLASDKGDGLRDMIDLVSTLCVARPFFSSRERIWSDEDDYRLDGCDAVARIRGLRCQDPAAHSINREAHREARQHQGRLHRAFGRLESVGPEHHIDRRRLALALLGADGRMAHVARRRKKRVAWSNGSTEKALGNTTALAPDLDSPAGRAIEAIIALETRAIGTSTTDGRVMITCAMPVPIPWLVAAGLGQDEVGAAVYKGGHLSATIERRYANRVLSRKEESPRGEAARSALVRVIMEDRVWPGCVLAIQNGIDRLVLAKALGLPGFEALQDCPSEAREWLIGRVAELGVESGDDLELLELSDVLPPALPDHMTEHLSRTFPLEMKLPDVSYRLEYSVARKTVRMHKTSGRRREPPPVSWLPRFNGFKVILVDNRGEHLVRK